MMELKKPIVIRPEIFNLLMRTVDGLPTAYGYNMKQLLMMELEYSQQEKVQDEVVQKKDDTADACAGGEGTEL